jgi:hypothetical protein
MCVEKYIYDIKPEDYIAMNQQRSPVGVCGFVFAFFKYSRMHNRGVWESIVHFALQDDAIHVAVVPAPSVTVNPTTGKIEAIVLEDTAFTAFMGFGYEKDHVSSVLTDEFDYVFVPVAVEAYAHGVKLLNRLKGKKYNYLNLPLTLIPRSWKRMNAHSSEVPKRVFCSQVGLMLCYTCNVFANQDNEDPAYCSPRDLYDLIVQKGHGVCCGQNVFWIKACSY